MGLRTMNVDDISIVLFDIWEQLILVRSGYHRSDCSLLISSVLVVLICIGVFFRDNQCVGKEIKYLLIPSQSHIVITQTHMQLILPYTPLLYITTGMNRNTHYMFF